MKLYQWILMTALVAAPSLSMARGGHHKHWKEMMSQLDLSEEQRTKIKDIRQSSRDEHKETRKTLKETRRSFEELLGSDAAESEIRKAHETLQGLKAKMAEKRFENMMAIRAILTPEQRKKFHELRPKKGRHHRNHDNDDD
ncbi:Spy/CpxP family protein refolding chaperone [Pseudobacteriovorax antillogorgiicola]|uniref:Protein refolding chaperone Spy/CpxP family n=1 Tax=Pseudobacteriovorax antillogorgiicola TaxID=1513793 RepID=A0A1Y6CGV6_9BACT|nr:Spy/CpxP family protein refolding chaperone [Pseudobacteriovorax antillogorgiicola]TCS47362.1 Spy/CpxP family protein refolding chaperone [Pseudobacteriovorax antillogorgiicola]SMF63343.1 protein refolding chaperone Spy/CpxP family [Pseudobacteriovorax antillogorgiicola]